MSFLKYALPTVHARFTPLLAKSARWLVLLAMLVLQPALRAAELIKVGASMPDWASFGLEGKLPDLKGKVVLVDFWASWCGPCKKSFPVIKELHEKYSVKGLTVVGVSLDEKKREMDDFLKKVAPPFAILRDAKGKMAEALGIETIPTSLLIDASGKVLAVHIGFEGESTKQGYVREIENALKAKGGTP